MRDEFYITRSGKRYVLFAGLLDEAHGRGLTSIDTEIIQIPTPENNHVAVVKATAEMTNMDEEAVVKHKTFSGIGDASPQSTTKQMTPHIIRLAETRAKARALRDAVNIGVTALEELSDDSSEPPVKRVNVPLEEFSHEHMAQVIYNHMLEHGWSSDEISAYEDSHKALIDHSQEQGRKLFNAVREGMKP